MNRWTSNCASSTRCSHSSALHRRRVFFDPYQMQASAQRLKREGIIIEEFPQSVPNLTEASQNLYELIKGRNLVVYPDDAMRLAVSRAVAVEGSRGWRIAKEKQAHKIDVVVALGMAALAAVKGQSTYNTAARGSRTRGWAGTRRPEIVKERRARLVKLLKSGAPYHSERKPTHATRRDHRPFGRKRRARKGEVLVDGETMNFPVTLMDEMTRVMSDAMESDRMIRDGMAHPQDIALDMLSLPMMRACAMPPTTPMKNGVNACRMHGASVRRNRTAMAPRVPSMRNRRKRKRTAWEDKKERLAQAWRHR